jgi:FkbM family methyltransferase
VEGNPAFLVHLRENIRQVSGAILEETFLGEHTGDKNVFVTTHASTGNITASEDGPSGFKQSGPAQSAAPVAVKLTTLDDLLTKHRFEPHILKIDCDGYDFKVLRGALQTLTRVKPALVFEWSPIHQILHRVERDPSEIWPFLDAKGYTDFFIYNPQSLMVLRAGVNELAALRSLEQFALASITHFDVVCFHSEDVATHDGWKEKEDRRLDSIIESNWGDRWRNRLRA